MGSPSHTMVSALALSVVTIAVTEITAVGGAPPPCCTSKMVGGVEYILRKEEDTSNYNCVDNCIFEKMEEPGPLFCFATGDFEVICDDAPPNPGSGEGGSGSGPPSEGGNEGGSGGGGGSPSEEGSGDDSEGGG